LDRTVEAKFVAAPVRLTVLPAHTVLVELLAVTAVGADFTRMVTSDVLVYGQPDSVPVTVYVVPVVGEADTLAPVVVFNPVLGAHVYVVAPEALSVAGLPGQISAEVGDTDVFGAHGVNV